MSNLLGDTVGRKWVQSQISGAVLNGVPGPQGQPGKDGLNGAPGPTGPAGADGVGVPAGGTTGQILAKIDGTDYNTQWTTPSGGSLPAGGVTDDLLVKQSSTDGDATWKSTLNKVQLNTGYTITGSEPAGTIFWDSTNNTAAIKIDSDVTLQLGQENHIRCYNTTGSTIPNGSVVYCSGAHSHFPTIALAKGDSAATCNVIGVTTEDIANNSYGMVTSQGLVNGLDTHSFAAGDKLWVSKTTAGAFVNAEPAVPHHSDFIGYVTYSNPVQGTIYVTVTPHRTLETLSDVDGTPLTTTGQIPVWNNTAGYFDFTSNVNGFVPTTRTVNGHALSSDVTVAYSDLSGIPSSFTPAAHASTHSAAGSDPITISESQVTGLVADLAAKLDSSTAASTYVPYSGATTNVDLNSKNITTTGTGTVGNLSVTGTAAGVLPNVSGISTSFVAGSYGWPNTTLYFSLYTYKVINGIKYFSSTPNQKSQASISTFYPTVSWTADVSGLIDGYRLYGSSSAIGGPFNGICYVDIPVGTNSWAGNTSALGFFGNLPNFENEASHNKNAYSNSISSNGALSKLYGGASLDIYAALMRSHGSWSHYGTASLNGTTTVTGQINVTNGSITSLPIAMGFNGSQCIMSTNIPIGASNVVVGANGLAFTSTSGTRNVAIGTNSASAAAGTITDNVFIGYISGTLESGSNNVCIGSTSNGGASHTYNATIAIGSNSTPTASNQLLLGGSTATTYVNDAYIGNGVTIASPQPIVINATGGSGTNIAGAKMTIAGGKSTGSATPAVVALATSTTGSSGTTLQTLSDRVVVSENNTQFTHGVRVKRTPISSNYTALANDYFIQCTSGTFTVTLPSVVDGQVYIIKNSGAGVVTVSTTDQGAVALVAGTALQVVGDGTAWQVC